MKKVPVRVLADLLEQITTRKFPYEPKEEKLRDWPAYNRARVKELSNVLDLIKSYVDSVDDYELPEKNSNGGHGESITVQEKAKAVLLAEFLQADERTASDWINILGPRLGMVSEMSPRTIGRAYYDERVKALLQLVRKKTSLVIQGNENSFSGDSTGQKKNNRVHYSRDKLDDEKRKDFAMASLMVSNHYHVCTAFVFHSSGPINDSPILPELWKQTLDVHGEYITEAQFDAGFLSRANIGLVAKTATPYFFPKKNLTLNAKGCPAWTNMLYNCVTDTQNWLRGYHPRNNSETYNGCLQKRYPKPLNCKYPAGQETEDLSRIIGENFAQLNVAREEEKLDLTPQYCAL
jgi:transposase